MAQFIEPATEGAADYLGLRQIFEFTNWDGGLPAWNCGQAAAATLLTFRNIFAPDPSHSGQVMREIEAQFPPDIAAGWLGTSRRRVEKICRAYENELDEIEGEEALRMTLSKGKPTLVMLSVPGPKLFGGRITLPAGHWMVAYGFTQSHIYLTNMGRLSWAEFHSGWDSMISAATRMRKRGLGLAQA